jgi:hypothetical protein
MSGKRLILSIPLQQDPTTWIHFPSQVECNATIFQRQLFIWISSFFSYNNRYDLEKKFMNKTAKFITGAVIGALAGGIVVILLTPGSGEDTRLAFSEKIQYIRNQMQEAARQKRLELETELENYKQAS